jgi:HrpA-like RNA helicase
MIFGTFISTKYSFNNIDAKILDEFHERTAEMDIIFAFVMHSLQKEKIKLKLIVMSATLEEDLFLKYKTDCS